MSTRSWSSAWITPEKRRRFTSYIWERWSLLYKNIRFEVWDLGGQERLRTSWATYYRGTNAVIVVIDSTDRARISIIKDELFNLLPHEDLQNAVVLVYANKQDLKEAMTPAEITDAISLHSIKNHDWHIQASCALTGDGLYDGLEWIAQRVTGKAQS
ncbi:PREDICTED: ADP-ribosylation factor-like protein 5 isoform X2 [Ipomoea nil]|uniref:ADP-ribosylation factor-like protein 5 isoform X2 n=1 Tax=Ipomoea nil TaxID=35883 RepID=UPI0009013E3B|nr:PREDICTED: ADP-ribosylation factor-like protein 5 isoform X2 [Ipomoea nil]